MNTLQKIIIISVCLFFSVFSYGQEETGLAGDHFSLEGALDIFKKASSIEEFEELLNAQNNNVNNLDLNEDGEVDYIRIEDYADGDAHALVLQATLSEDENQDIAVIEIEKTGKDKADLQIIGDVDIFGEEIIVEATELEETLDKKGRGPNVSLPIYEINSYIIVNVWTWPSVRFIYAPMYRPYVSPWRWRAYPVWYRPWRPLSWSVFHPHRIRFVGYRVAPVHRVVAAHKIYSPKRRVSVTVTKRYSKPLNNYRVTRSTKTTKITGPKGRTHTKKETQTKISKKGKGRNRKG